MEGELKVIAILLSQVQELEALGILGRDTGTCRQTDRQTMRVRIKRERREYVSGDEEWADK